MPPPTPTSPMYVYLCYEFLSSRVFVCLCILLISVCSECRLFFFTFCPVSYIHCGCITPSCPGLLRLLYPHTQPVLFCFSLPDHSLRHSGLPVRVPFYRSTGRVLGAHLRLLVSRAARSSFLDSRLPPPGAGADPRIAPHSSPPSSPPSPPSAPPPPPPPPPLPPSADTVSHRRRRRRRRFERRRAAAAAPSPPPQSQRHRPRRNRQHIHI